MFKRRPCRVSEGLKPALWPMGDAEQEEEEEEVYLSQSASMRR
jgi:hypothetical protein